MVTIRRPQEDKDEGILVEGHVLVTIRLGIITMIGNPLDDKEQGSRREDASS